MLPVNTLQVKLVEFQTSEKFTLFQHKFMRKFTLSQHSRHGEKNVILTRAKVAFAY